MTLNLKVVVMALSLTVFATTDVNATTSSLTLTSGAAPFSHTFTTDGMFSDAYTFNVASGSEGIFSANVASQYATLFSHLIYGIDITSFNLTGTSAINGVETATTKLFGTLHNDIWSLNGSLVAGAYSLNVAGKSDSHIPFIGLIPTTYSGSASLAVSPVPEAETYSMMLLGLGLMGFVASRRKTK